MSAIKEISVRIGGMSCAMCSKTVTLAIKKISGVIDVSVNLSSEKALIKIDRDVFILNEVKKTIEDLGYEFIDTGFDNSIKKKV